MHTIGLAATALLSATFATAAPLTQVDGSPNVTSLLRRADPGPVGCGRMFASDTVYILILLLTSS